MKNRGSTLKNKLSLKMPIGYNKPIHLATLLLSFFGILMVISASQGNASVSRLLFVGAKEVGFAVVGYISMVIFARNFSFTFFKKHFTLITIGVFVLLLITRAFGGVNGAYAWLRFGPVTIQPAEFAKIYAMLLIAVKLGDKRHINPRITGFDLMKYPVFIILAMAAIITVWQKDFGSAFVLMGIASICFLIPTNQRLWKTQKVLMGLILLVFVLAFLLTKPAGLAFLEHLGIPHYMLKRFVSAADPFADRYDAGYQIFMGLVAMVKGTEGSIFGRGYGQGINKHGYIPEPNTDFIIAVIVEELGIIGILIIAVGYGLIVYNLLKDALLFKRERDKIILIGCAAYLIIHTTLNLGGATGFVPLTGVPLLLISAGGSGRLAFMVAMGLAQNVISRNVGLKKIKTKRVKS